MISGPSTEVRQTLGRAEQLLRMRRTAEAAALLRRLAAEFPAHTEPLRVHALALRELGDLRAAEAQLRAAIEIDPRQPLLYVTLAEVLLRARRPEAAETQYRRALALDAGFGPAVVGLAELLLEGGRAADALEATSMAVSAAGADIAVWTVHANALKALGRHDEALPAYRRASELAPRSAVAEHNLAGVLGDMGRFAESEAAARRAFAKGGQAPETWLVHGRALMGQARLDEAEGAFRESIRRRPAYAEPVADLAQLIWMRTEDVGAACAPLNEAIQAAPSVPALRIAKSKLLEYAGDLEGAYAAVADLAAQAGADPALHLKAAQVAAAIDAPKALAHAEAAFATAPENLFIGQALCASLLAVGRADSAARLAQTLRERSPLDQYLLGLLVTAWRLLDDPRAADLADYEGLVRSQPIDTPDGWKSLEAYLSDLGESLVRMHPFQGHPLGQSLRGGSQTQHGLDRSVDPSTDPFGATSGRSARAWTPTGCATLATIGSTASGQCACDRTAIMSTTCTRWAGFPRRATLICPAPSSGATKAG